MSPHSLPPQAPRGEAWAWELAGARETEAPKGSLALKTVPSKKCQTTPVRATWREQALLGHCRPEALTAAWCPGGRVLRAAG